MCALQETLDAHELNGAGIALMRMTGAVPSFLSLMWCPFCVCASLAGKQGHKQGRIFNHIMQELAATQSI
eukprot:1160437-Pelagomonas_calceolata.AAC.12